jgi:hypothetical protein
MAQAMDADMQMVIEGYTASGLSARQLGQRCRRLRELNQRLQRDGDRVTDGPTSTATALRSS